MKARTWILLGMFWLGLGCESRGAEDPRIPAAEAPGQVDSVELTAQVADTTNWWVYQHYQIRFLYPADWQVRLEENESREANQPRYYLRVENADRARPLAITLEIYEGMGDKNWEQFLSYVCGDLITHYRPYVLPSRNELDAITAIRVRGVYVGQPRFFVKIHGVFYDAALTYQGVDAREAQKILNGFLKNFSF